MSYTEKINKDRKPDVSLQYETIMGSVAYGASIGETKDIDIYGWAFPSRQEMFPYSHGIVAGFNDKEAKTFEQFQKMENVDGQEIDFSIYGVSKYLRLVSQGNPNMLDSLFTRDEDVTFITERGQKMRDNRNMFLSQMAVRKCLGFANSELQKIRRSFHYQIDGTRSALVEKHGYDTKSAYHLVRILSQGYQIATEHDLAIYDEERATELLHIRDGGYTFESLIHHAEYLMFRLEKALSKTTLRENVDKKEVLNLLMELLDFYD